MKAIFFTLIFILSANSYGSCGVTWTAENNGDVRIHLMKTYSKVKVKGGWYKKFMSDTITYISPGDSVSEAERLDLSCNKKRRFKIYVACEGVGGRNVYFPSSSSYYPKEKTWFDFGDLSRFCD